MFVHRGLRSIERVWCENFVSNPEVRRPGVDRRILSIYKVPNFVIGTCGAYAHRSIVESVKHDKRQ